jgi:putative phage-type endonuclease
MRNASETPAVMGCSPWFPKSHIQLARVKRGLDAVFETRAMAYGTANEARARAKLEQLTDLVFEPAVAVDGDYSASLDGRTFDGETILEVKCPASGEKSSLFDASLPMNYLLQVQHQLMVSKAKKCLFFVWTPHTHRLVEITPNETLQQNIRDAWDAFWPLMSVPEEELAVKEIAERSDSDWFLAVEAYNTARQARVLAEEQEATARNRLIELADGMDSQGYGVRVASATRAGNVNYKAIPELKGVDLDKYRAPPTPYWVVREVKAKEGEAK